MKAYIWSDVVRCLHTIEWNSVTIAQYSRNSYLTIIEIVIACILKRFYLEHHGRCFPKRRNSLRVRIKNMIQTVEVLVVL